MKINVLDHGYVELIEAYGHGKAGIPSYASGAIETYGEQAYDNEVGIIEAARQSTQGSFRGWEPAKCTCIYGKLNNHVPDPFIHKANRHEKDCAFRLNPGDKNLLAHLNNHEPPHATPFEFSGMIIEVQAPIFVFREWHRHRTQSYNEASARYAPLPELYYFPDAFVTQERTWHAYTSKNKQAQNIAEPPPPQTRTESDAKVNQWLRDLDRAYQYAEATYRTALAEGIPKELARLIMPVGHYSKMRAAANLRNWLGFLTLRRHPDAQYEIRLFAEAVAVIIEQTFPQTWKLYEASK